MSQPGPESWHEAGHAVVAHLLGGRVCEVTLESELDGHDGHVAVEWPRPRDRADDRRLARLELAVAFAGPLLEALARGELALEGTDDPVGLGAWADEPRTSSAWRGDWEAARMALERAEPAADRRTALCGAVVREVRALIARDEVYERVARVADMLDAHQTLDRELFEEAMG